MENSPAKTEERTPETKRVLVAMSGGVDSSVAALLLQQAGFDVIAATFTLYSHHNTGLCARADLSRQSPVLRAKDVCMRLGIPHRVLMYEDCFRRQVIEPFCTEYASGRTPNPCVVCNRYIKWGSFLDDAMALGCRWIATGHYARVRPSEGRLTLLRGVDGSKDQSYALYLLSQYHLAHTLFPLGAHTKAEVRNIALAHDLPSSQVAESQDICFLAQKEDYRTFLSKRITCSPGVIVDTSGTVRGTHRGLPFYTVGQRKGLGVPWKGRLFVIEKDAECNRLIVGSREELARNVFSVHSVNWVSIPPPSEGAHLNADVCVRYRSHPLSARLCVEEKGLVSVMVQPHDQAIAPGQSAVWYEGDVLLGGGIIQ